MYSTCVYIYSPFPISTNVHTSQWAHGDNLSLQLNGTDISRAPMWTIYQFRAEGKTVMTISVGDKKKAAPWKPKGKCS